MFKRRREATSKSNLTTEARIAAQDTVRRNTRLETEKENVMIWEDENSKTKYLINIDGDFKAIWDILNTILIGYIMLLLPFKLSFT